MRSCVRSGNCIPAPTHLAAKAPDKGTSVQRLVLFDVTQLRARIKHGYIFALPNIRVRIDNIEEPRGFASNLLSGHTAKLCIWVIRYDRNVLSDCGGTSEDLSKKSVKWFPLRKAIYGRGDDTDINI